MHRRVLSGGVVVAVLSLLLVAAPPFVGQASAKSGFNLSRLAGSDRYATASAIAQAAYPSGAANAVLATGEAFPDALSGSFLAATSAPRSCSPPRPPSPRRRSPRSPR